jgi:S1-C subfamily serine protease
VTARLGVTVALLAAACAGPRPASERGQVIRAILPATVQLRVERADGPRRSGSGVVLAADAATGRAWIVTAGHLVQGAGPQQVYARRPGRQESVRAAVAVRSAELDLALLEVQGLELRAAPLKPVAVLGDPVLLVAYPWGRRLTVVGGIVSQLVPPPDGTTPVEGRPRMVDASVSYGSSGGGVFDARDGELIAVVEGYRTAKVTLPERPDRTIDIPVPGETTVIAAAAIRQLLVDAGLERFLPR